MVFDNSKRMGLVQDLLKEKKGDKLKKKKSARGRDALNSSRHSLGGGGSSHNGLGVSGHSKGTLRSTTSSYSQSSACSADFQKDPLDFKNIMKLQKSWETIKDAVDSATLGEHIVLNMMQLDPKTREKLNIDSPRSEKCQGIATAIIETIDCLIFLLGPDFDHEDVADSVENLTREGVAVDVLAKALPQAVLECADSLSTTEQKVWRETMEAALMKAVPNN